MPSTIPGMNASSHRTDVKDITRYLGASAMTMPSIWKVLHKAYNLPGLPSLTEGFKRRFALDITAVQGKGEHAANFIRIALRLSRSIDVNHLRVVPSAIPGTGVGRASVVSVIVACNPVDTGPSHPEMLLHPRRMSQSRPPPYLETYPKVGIDIIGVCPPTNPHVSDLPACVSYTLLWHPPEFHLSNLPYLSASSQSAAETQSDHAILRF